MAGRPAPWPRLRDTWWVVALGLLALALFSVGFLVRLRCGLGTCPARPLGRLLDLDAVGGLPRLFTTGLFLGVAWWGWRGFRATAGRAALWWTAVTLIGLGLALAKLISVHSTAKAGLAPSGTLLVGLLLTVPALGALYLTGRSWGVRGTRAVVVALAAYALAALGLDLLTGALGAVQDRIGPLTLAASTYVEELGEALSALCVLVVVRWQVPATTPGPVGPAASH
jgi:hypothetical protein